MLPQVQHSDKRILADVVDSLDEQLRRLALRLHANPELSFQEHQAMAWLTAPLQEAGFEVEMGIAGLETAFRARWQGAEGGPTIALLAEYDALPELGHACGHNLIGTASVGAALALKQAFPDLPGTILVIGTPAEEEGGGKIIQCQHGIFDEVDAAMLCHPRSKNMVLRGGLACVDAVFRFRGRAAHAASAPQDGISALDAVIQTFNGVNALRQLFTDDVRVHGIITHGGEATNIVPAYAEAKFLMRAANVKGLGVVRDKVFAAARGAAEASGARLEIEEGLTYAERNNNHALAGIFRRHLEDQGLEVEEPAAKGGIGSSDIGNVGQITATIHPYIRIGDCVPHTPEFAEAAGSEAGMQALSQATRALAMTAFELCVSPEAMAAVRGEFESWRANR
ncbi:amidohydrolase [Salinicola sp. MH3R3-1]|nr:amidohydrolase [Salinicola sp. MH3R3-1]